PQHSGDRPHRALEQVRRGGANERDSADARAEQLGLSVGRSQDRYPAEAVADDHGPVRDERLDHDREVRTHRARREIASGGAPAPPMRAQVEQDAPEPLRERGPLVVPRRHVKTEPVNEDDGGARRVARCSHRERRAVEGLDRSEVLGGQQRQWLVGLRIPPTAKRRPGHHPTGHGPEREPRGDQRGSPTAHPRYSRGTRSEIAVAISYPIVPTIPASSSAVIRSPPCSPMSTTGSPTRTSSSPQSTMIWSIVTVPATRRRFPPIRTSA